MASTHAITLGELLKNAREKRDLTLQDVADMALCSKSYVWELEADKSMPSLAVAAALAHVLHLDLSVMGLYALRTGIRGAL